MRTEFSHIPFYRELSNDKIVCQNCHWSWRLKDGGNDPYVCHSCGFDNSEFYSNFDTVGAVAGAVGSVANLGTSTAQAKANKEASKNDTQKEIETRCGKRVPIGKKKKSAYNQCKTNVITLIDSEKQSSKEEKQKAQEFLQKQSAEREKSQRTQTYIVIGIVAVIIGVVIYKKMNK